jgi:cobalt-zinc-cadmium efflux system protein
MSHQHAHGHQEQQGSPWRLIGALLLNVGITVAQIVGGLLSGSLSLLADAAHNGSDAVSLGISYQARRIARREADRRRTFGYNRAELIGAMINLTTLFVIALYLLYEAVQRFISPPEVEGITILIVSAIAFVEDALSVWLLSKDMKGSLNIRAAFIHLLADTLSTVGVMAGGLLILFYDVYWVDPAVTAAIAVYIIVHGYIEIRKTIRILVESAPEGFDFDRMVREVEALDGVSDLHHVHVWQLDEHRVAMEAHLTVGRRDLQEIEAVKRRVKEKLRRDFGVEHTTLEIETGDEPDHDRSIIPRS